MPSRSRVFGRSKREEVLHAARHLLLGSQVKVREALHIGKEAYQKHNKGNYGK